MKKTSRIVINVADQIPEDRAIQYVETVMSKGKISGMENESYCYATVFKDGVVVSTDKPRKRSPNTYVFYVYQDERRKK